MRSCRLLDAGIFPSGSHPGSISLRHRGHEWYAIVLNQGGQPVSTSIHFDCLPGTAYTAKNLWSGETQQIQADLPVTLRPFEVTVFDLSPAPSKP